MSDVKASARVLLERSRQQEVAGCFVLVTPVPHDARRVRNRGSGCCPVFYVGEPFMPRRAAS